MEKKEIKKNLSYDDKVIEKIAGLATQEVDGVQPLSGGLIGDLADKIKGSGDKTIGIDAEVGKKQVALDINVVCRYGIDVPKAFEQVVTKASDAVKKMTGLDVIEVNMNVENILNEEDFNKKDTSDSNEDKK